MRVGIDARELAGRPTGVGRYLRGLVTEWTSSPTAARHEFLLYTPERLDLPLDPERFRPRVIAGAGGTWWEQRALAQGAARDGLDVFFAPGYTAPLTLDARLVVAIHDVSFAAHPEWYRVREGMRRRLLSRLAARRAAAVITISQFSKREIVDHLGVPRERIHVIPPGVALPPSATAVDRPPDDARVLFVGSIFNRRRVPDLIRAVARLARHGRAVSLDIVGDNRSYPRQDLELVIAAEGAAAIVRWRQYVAEDELAQLYARARAFAFLSEYEGLGLTPLEALAAGVPPVLLDTAVARESCADAALYVAHGDLAGTAAALERVLFDDAVRRRLLAAAPAALAPYNAARSAERTLSLLEQP